MSKSAQIHIIRAFKETAANLDLAIAITFLERVDGAVRNSMSLIDRFGKVVLDYAKVHACSFDREAILAPGSHFPVCSLDTKAGSVKIGSMICFDREFPESARVLALKGAEIILVPNACTMDDPRVSQLKSRAFENMTGIALANYPPPSTNGHSMALSGMAYDKRESARNLITFKAGDAEGVYLADFDLVELRAYREREVWGGKFRRVEAYEGLI